MKNLLVGMWIAVAAFFSVAPETNAASAGNEPTLSAWLVQCQSNRQECLDYLRVYFAFVDDAGACPPETLTQDSALEAELVWLQNAAARDPSLAARTRYAAQFTAMSSLWPCK